MRAAIESWLSKHCAVLDGTAIGAVLLRRGDGLHTMAVWPAGRTLPPQLANAAAAAVARRQRVVGATQVAAPAGGAASERVEVIAHPLQASGVLIGAAVVLVRAPQALAPKLLDRLSGTTRLFEASLGSASSKPMPAAAPGGAVADPAARVLAIAQTAFEHTDLRGAAVALTASLAAALSCDRVSLGFRNGRQTQVVAVSDGSTVDAKRGVFADVAAAMDEAIDDAATLVYPQPDGQAPRIVAAHTHLAKRQSLEALCSVPLVHAGDVIGALTLERSQGHGFDASAVALLEGVSRAVSPWLATQRTAALPIGQQLRRRIADGMKRFGGPSSGRFKLAALAAGVMLGTVLVLPIGHEVSASARLEGTTQRVMAAPSDGYLKQVFVRPGDSVRSGQVLVEFEGEDLLIERQRLAAEIAGEEAAVGDAMSRHDRTKLAIASAKVGELRAQLALVEQRIERAQIKAPFDGVVIQGDLMQALGSPVKRGDALLTLAPSDGFRAIVEVEDADIADIRPGQHGTVVLTAHPDRVITLQVARITPLATVHEGRNVFEIEVVVAGADAPDQLRPGMRGVARLTVGEKPLAALWTRDAIAWLRLATWRWVG
jgi:hypothetical protein